MSSTISYNGSTITTLDDGETATLSTAAKYVPYNLVVTDTTDVSDALEAIADKGVTIPSDAGRDDLADLIGQIQQGGGSAITITDEPATGGGTHRIITAVSLENDTVTAATLANGITAHDKFGNAITGTGGGGGDTPVIDEWVRPSTWPDLDSIQMANDFEGVYLTYDLSQFPVANPWIGFLLKFVDSSSTATVERGHLSNGTFVADATYTATHNIAFRQDLNENNGTVQLWRIYTSGKITNFQFKGRTGPSTTPLNQACVEITGQLNNLVEITTSSNPTSSSSSSYSWGTYFLQRDSRKCGGTVTSLAYAWYYCYVLQSLDVSKWNTTNWTVTTLHYAWYYCYALQSLDLSNWDTKKWEVTDLSYCWRYCYSLQVLNVSNWDTTNWEVTDLSYCWYGCHSLRALDLSNWDTKKWALTTLTNCWYSCYSLQVLNVSTWNTTNWEVTDLSYCWFNCCSLQALDLSNWDTKKWEVTTLNSCWYGCYSLQALDLSNWNTINWEVTTLNSCWYYCCSLRALDLSNWNTTNWALTTLSACWRYCYKLNKLNVSGWSISNTINNVGYWLSSCVCLDTLKGFNDWTGLTSITSTFIENWYCLKNCDGFPISINHSYANSRLLTHDSLVTILNALPTVETSKTITLGSVNLNKLTDAEIAVATAKGWTVA